jgi:hypothetical protein
MKQYQWTVLPQGKLNCPSQCKHFVNQPLSKLITMFNTVIFIHYTNDTLFAMETQEGVIEQFTSTQKILPQYGLVIASEEIKKEPYMYVGYILERTHVKLQKISVCSDTLKTLNDFQKLLGHINWLRHSLGIPNYALQHSFNILNGDSDITSPRVLSSQAKKELQVLKQYIQKAYIDHIDLSFSFSFSFNPTPHSPTACIAQESDIIIKWIFLPNKENK